MKKLLTAAAVIAAVAASLFSLWEPKVCAQTSCKDTYSRTELDTVNLSGCEQVCSFKLTKHWNIYFMDGYERRINPYAYGQGVGGMICWPSFETPTFVDDGHGSARWTQIPHSGVREDATNPVTGQIVMTCASRLKEIEELDWTVGHTCQRADSGGGCTTAGWDGSCPPGTYPNESGMCCADGGGDAGFCEMGCSWSFMEGQCLCNSPILIDILGDGFSLTDAAGGVLFDLNRDGARERLAWTQAGSDDAWLSLDVDGDGAIGDGGELFGNYTRQPHPPEGQQKNGFLALGVYDRPAGGGNGDGLIDGRDAVFSSLRLWRDANHDGVSQTGELHALAALGLDSIALDYRESGRRDAHGNRFRYRAKVADARGAQLGRWAWDVFLVNQP